MSLPHFEARKTLLVAPDSFKGSMSAVEICATVERWASQQAYPIKVLSRPMSDGGEGFVDAFIFAGLAESIHCEVQDPLGRMIRAQFAWQETTQTAIIEMAQASGLPLLTLEERNPCSASTYGTGQLIMAAIHLGAKKIVLGLGGSATNDGGAGALQAMGFQLLDSNKQQIPRGAQGLAALAKIRFNHQAEDYAKLQTIEWVIACDVSNPLLGPQGATAVFGPQKGVTSKKYPLIETSLQHFADMTERTFKRAARNLPGAGAAGGMAFGLVGFLDAKLVSGFSLLSELLALESLFEQEHIDLVLTAEGRIDEQTQYGKLPAQIALLAQKYQVPCMGLCGQLATTLEQLPMFGGLYSIHESMPKGSPLEILLAETPRNLLTTLEVYGSIWFGSQHVKSA